MRTSVGLVAVLIMFAPATAQMGAMAEPTDCPAAASTPPELAGWKTRSPLAGAGEPSSLRKAQLSVGGGVDAVLIPTTDVRYVTRPEKPGGSVSYGGLFAFTVAEAGTYRIALGSGAWIDVLKDGKALASSAHGHGPTCSGIRKMVDFPLTPGRYILQVAANGGPSLPLLLSRLP